MNVRSGFARLVQGSAAAVNPLQPLVGLGLRVYVGWQFFRSGLAKLQDWSSTLFLFSEEYRVPLLPPEIAAVAGTIGEIAFPILLWIGLCTRLAAAGLSAVNVVAVVAYSSVLLSDGFEAALGQHVLWGLMLLVTMIYGPGRLSFDGLVLAPRGGDKARAY